MQQQEATKGCIYTAEANVTAITNDTLVSSEQLYQQMIKLTI